MMIGLMRGMSAKNAWDTEKSFSWTRRRTNALLEDRAPGGGSHALDEFVGFTRDCPPSGGVADSPCFESGHASRYGELMATFCCITHAILAAVASADPIALATDKSILMGAVLKEMCWAPMAGIKNRRTGMDSNSTDMEVKAARDLGEALLRFVVAVDEGRRRRHPPRTTVVRKVIEKVTDPPVGKAAVAEVSSVMGTSPGEPAGKTDRLLLRAREAAETLGIGSRTLWVMTKCGEIPSVRIGKSVRYSPIQLQEWIEAQVRRKPSS